MTNDKLWFRGVRPSKFRHVYGLPSRKESCYTDVNVARNTNDGHVCAVNPKFLALSVDSTFAILSTFQTGRIDFQSCKVIGHVGQITDLKWNPFNDNIIASASDDCIIKIWEIPEGLKTNLDEFKVELIGHKRKVLQIEWHPTVDNIIFSVGFDNLVYIWDLENPAEPIKAINCHIDTIYSLALNRDASFMATTSKDKKLRIIEPRSGIVVSEGICHASTKCTKVVFLDYGKVLTTGFSRHSDRQYCLWDQHNLKQPLIQENVDSSSGVLTPYYDYDTKMLYLAGKGDGNIRYYEIVDEPPYIYYLNQYLSGQPQKALGILPKRGVNVHQCEIFRFYKIYASGNICEPIGMIVPRKAPGFQSDLYPDTIAAKPAATIAEWLSGRNIQPSTMSLAYEKSDHDTNGLTNGTSTLDRNSRIHIDKYETDKHSQQKKIDNNSKKFAFLSQQTVPDYRPKLIDKNVKTETNESTKFSQLQSVFGGGKTKEISNYQNNLISNSKDNSGHNLTEKELRIAYANQVEEIKNLKNQLLCYEKRFQELEDTIKRLTNSI